MKQKLLWAALVAVALAACGGGDDDNTSNSNTASTTPGGTSGETGGTGGETGGTDGETGGDENGDSDGNGGGSAPEGIAGEWITSACIADDPTAEDTNYNIVDLDISTNGSIIEVEEYTFADVDCTMLLGATTGEFAATYPGGMTIVTSGMATHVDLTLLSLELVDAEGNPVPAGDGGEDDEIGEIDYDILFLDSSGPMLYFGDDSGERDGSTADKRPEMLDLNEEFIVDDGSSGTSIIVDGLDGDEVGEPPAGFAGTTWIGDCLEDDDEFSRLRLTTAEDGLSGVITENYYADSACTNQEGVADYSFVVYDVSFIFPGETSETSLGTADHIDVTYESVRDTDATGTSLIELGGQIGEIDYDLVFVSADGMTLYDGNDDTGDGSSAANRPTDLDQVDTLSLVADE